MLTKLNHVLLAGVVALACSSCQTEKKADYQVIPLPQEVVLTQEKPFLLNKNVSITYPEGNLLLKRNAEFLSGYIRQATGYTPPVKGLKDGETFFDCFRRQLSGLAHGYESCKAPAGKNPQRLLEANFDEPSARSVNVARYLSLYP